MEPKAVCNEDSPAESNGGELNTGYTPYPLDKLGMFRRESLHPFLTSAGRRQQNAALRATREVDTEL